jgi:hypothetical protein
MAKDVNGIQNYIYNFRWQMDVRTTMGLQPIAFGYNAPSRKRC